MKFLVLLALCGSALAKVDVACLEPKKPGPCYAYVPRYYYNQTTGTCEEFIWGGCQENGNNFETLEVCQSRCRYVPGFVDPTRPYPLPVEARVDVACLEPKKPGPCLAYVPRYYYNKTTGTCEEFIWGGCQENGNNFETLEVCKSRCRYVPGFVDPTRPYPLPVEARVDVACLEPKKPGPCLAYVPRYYYNKTTGTCEEFIWGGCQENGNNFETLEVCKSRCRYVPGFVDPTRPYPLPVEARVDVACLEPKKPGPCYAYVPRYYYNKTTGTCEEFIWGGCQENGNNFETLEVCKSRCRYVPGFVDPTRPYPLPVEARVDVACLEPKFPGPCMAYFPRYYYNQTTHTCEQFIYGGCQANGNNFQTLLECKRRCRYVPSGASTEEVSSETEVQYVQAPSYDELEFPYTRISARIDISCYEPVKTGPCRGLFLRYYYNNATKTCQQFTYGGCEANGNNFVTLEECQNRCRVSQYPEDLALSNAFELPGLSIPPPRECTFPKDVGACQIYETRYYYNTLTKGCEEFLYSGCGGNENNFRTYADCDNKCKKFLGVLPRA